MFEIYKGKRVLITGHKGFKGSWLTLWLNRLGAEVMGISRNPPTFPSHYELLGLDVREIRGDLRDMRDMRELTTVLNEFKPELVFHLAAQAIVAKTFGDPHGTFEGNIMGALNILEMCRYCKSVKGIVMVTTDKVYAENDLKDRGFESYDAFREDDELGGLDPYSASKVCIEHIIKCYQTQYFPMIATARAGNVIGGGDWAYKRLIPDIMRATSKGEPVEIHTPHATRPWQHVLEPLAGYLTLGERLLEGDPEAPGAWNFGPDGDMSVLDVLKIAQKVWPKIQFDVKDQEHHPSMVRLLKIDSSKARGIGWHPRWDIQESIETTVMWYMNYYERNEVTSSIDIMEYEND